MNTLSNILKDMSGKAYVILFELLDDKEQTKTYEIHYSNSTGTIHNFREWKTDIRNYKNIQEQVENYIQSLVAQLVFQNYQTEVVVRRILIRADGQAVVNFKI